MYLIYVFFTKKQQLTYKLKNSDIMSTVFREQILSLLYIHTRIHIYIYIDLLFNYVYYSVRSL